MITRYDPDALNVLGGPLDPCGLDPVKEALDAGAAPGVVLEATHEETLAVVPLDVLRAYAVSGSG